MPPAFNTSLTNLANRHKSGQHLNELKSVGLIKGSPDLPRIKYTLNEVKWKQARKLLKTFLKIKPVKSNPESVA